MAEEKPSLHIDTDWKRQAQEEKKRLAEQEAKAAQAAPVATAPTPGAAASAARSSAATASAATASAGSSASFASLVQSILTQVLYFLGDLSTRGGEPQMNLDMAKHQIDFLNVLEQKTAGNLTEDEKRLLDTALYETRMRYVNIASQFI